MLEFIQKGISEKVLDSISSEEVAFYGVILIYSWVSSA